MGGQTDRQTNLNMQNHLVHVGAQYKQSEILKRAWMSTTFDIILFTARQIAGN